MRWETDSLAHYGIKGQQWGIRRFQNPDGSLTPAGKQRYDTGKAEGKNTNKSIDDEVEYLETSNGKRLAVDPYGEYRYMKTGKDVGNHLLDLGSMTRESASEMAKGDREIADEMKKIVSEYEKLSKKYSSMKYSDIDFKQLKKEEKALSEREGKLMTLYVQKHYNDFI